MHGVLIDVAGLSSVVRDACWRSKRDWVLSGSDPARQLPHCLTDACMIVSVAGMPDGEFGHGELDEADAAWAEMYGGDGGGGGFDMKGMQSALPAPTPTTRLSPELTNFLSG